MLKITEKPSREIVSGKIVYAGFEVLPGLKTKTYYVEVNGQRPGMRLIPIFLNGVTPDDLRALADHMEKNNG